MVKGNGYLTHHEQLRYDYLLGNFQFLTDDERAELDYLTSKRNGQLGSSVEVGYGYDSEQSLGEFDGNYSESAKLTEAGLPLYAAESDTSSQVSQATQRVKKGKLKKNVKRVLLGMLAFLLLVIGGLVFFFVKGYQGGKSAQKGQDASAALVETFHGEDAEDGVNVLILGTDGRLGQVSEETRTDSIMVLNIGGKDGKIKLVSFMRDTLVNIPGVSQGNELDHKLNAAFSLGEQDNKQGAEAVRQMLKENFGLKIKYYAMVDFATFAQGIDTLFPDGVQMNAQFSTVDGQKVDQVDVPDDLNMKDGVVPDQTIKVGKQRMDGRTLLNYARFRKDDEGDFGRTRRQQEVMAAVLSQVKDPTKLFTGSEAIGKVFALTSTNIPFSFVLTNGVGTISDSRKGIDHVTIPENGDWIDALDRYEGQGLLIDFEKYQDKLKKMGLR